MKERERVFDLVKQGIITTEEALTLLENMAQEKSEQATRTTQTSAKEATEATGTSADSDLENHFENFANTVNQLSAEFDAVTAAIEKNQTAIHQAEEQLVAFETITEERELTSDEQAEKATVELNLQSMDAEQLRLEEKKDVLEKELLNVKRTMESDDSTTEENEWENNWNEFGQKVSESSVQFGKKLGETGRQFGKLMKDTVQSVTKSVNDSIDWKDVNIKVPGVASTTFTHEFYYPETLASLIDVKVANGEVLFSTWDSEDLKVEAEIKLYGKMEAATPLEAFLQRSTIDVDDDMISFQVPNKRIRIKLHFYLPTRMYDHVTIKLLNGDVELNNMQAKDVFVKSTNGEMTFSHLSATMLEIEGINGDIGINDSTIMDVLAESINGDFIFQGALQNTTVSLVDGDIKITTPTMQLNKIDAKVVNGAIKVAIPSEIGIEAYAKTGMGSIKEKLTNVEVLQEKHDKLTEMKRLRRLNEQQVAHLNLNSTTGSIYLKEVAPNNTSETE